MPLISEGDVTHDQAWGHTDVVGSRYPVSQTLLNQVFIEEISTEVFSRMGMDRRMGDPFGEGGTCDAGRMEVWRALRKSYHYTFTLVNMAVDRLKSDKNPAAFVAP